LKFEKGYRFYFYSNEEERLHVHVRSGDGEAKFWLDPIVALEYSVGFSPIELKKIQKVIENRVDEIKKAWIKFFKPNN